MKTFAGAVLAVFSGLIWAFCFAQGAAVAAPWVALVPLMLLLGSARPVLFGFLHGLAFWLASIHWIGYTMRTYGGLSTPLAYTALLALCAYLAVYTALFTALGSRVWRRGGVAAIWLLPAAWVALELVRGMLFSGFPWNLAGYAAVAVPGALPLSAWIGVYGISFLVVMANVAVARGIFSRNGRATVAILLTTFVSLALAQRSALRDPAPDAVAGSPLEVAIVQPNTPNLVAWDAEVVAAGYQRLMEQSRQACAPNVLVVWPESAAWPYSLSRDERLREDVDELADRGCAVLVNSPTQVGDTFKNSVFLVDGDTGTQRYDKRHLVPFGEYVPLGRWLPFLQRVARAAGDFTPGREGRLLDWLGHRLGVAICFEILFPAEVAERVRGGATLLVTVTNDAWYENSAAPWQHLRAALFRAAENRRPVLRAAITGVSAVIDGDGEVLDMLSVRRRGNLRTAVHGRSSLTLFARAPWLVPLCCLLLSAFAILRETL